MLGPDRNPATEATLRMPPRWRTRLSTQRSDMSVKLRTLRSIIASCSARSSAVAAPARPKPPLLITKPRSPPRPRVAAGKIDREHQRPLAVPCGNLVGKRVKFRLPACHQRQFVAVLGKHLRQRPSDARGGAGEHGDGPIKRH